MKRLLFIPLIIICLAVLSFQDARQINFKIQGEAQGTTYQISYYHDKEQVTKYQIDSILEVIDQSMSLYRPNSLISEINRSKKGVILDSHFLYVMKHAFKINEDTDGAFDVTVEPLLSAWGFSSTKTETLPSKETIAELLPLVGMDKIAIKGKRLKKKHPDVSINVNGIAQGYTVDVLANFLKSQNISSFFIELGGEIKAEGRKPDGSQFTIGVEGPVNSSGRVSIKHLAYLNNKAITTSGGYNQFIEKDGKKYIHILDPKTGFPVESDILSVTILADDAITADGYDNAVMAMGMSHAMEFLQQRPAIDGYIVYQRPDGTVLDTMTNGFKTIIKN
ncbi:FAD:protein FMN transferase [Albibacterium indicum]|uniref:FAD:protein FMN transferase n=1 Tax=Albibacterium indicum TaxID=2292082 RepID=UPI001300B764|nr:FAD:protein FMN transferase [Pedobacter indicus]